jgi:uncharacterized protein (UPF0333 family)
MSIEKPNNSSFLQDSDKVSMAATLATVILLIVAVVAGSYWGVADARKIEPVTNSTSSSTATNILEANSLPLPPSPPVIYAYSGEITSIEGETIYVRTNMQENGVSVEKDLKVSISGDTQYSKLDITKPPLAPGSEGEDEREHTIQSSEIQIGDRVIAQAGENIKDKTEFEATKIRVLTSGL